MNNTCLIVDNDPFAIEQLRHSLSLIDAPIKILGEAINGSEGIQQIELHNPSLIFLDIEMPDMSGFEMLTKLSSINFQTIFITSYSHYAIRAIRFNALDYLMKPIDIDELRTAISRFQRRTITVENIENTRRAIQNFSEPKIENKKILLQLQDRIIRPALREIVYIHGHGNYSTFRLLEQKDILISKTLKYFENRLADSGFYRCHKSYIVHRSHITAFTNSSSVIMSDNSEIPISRRRKSAMKNWYDAYQN